MPAAEAGIALGVAYRGTHLHGWQRQAAVPTAQQHIESALTRIAGHPVTVAAAGRTDAGVHATAQVVSFTTTAQRPMRAWLHGTNAHLPGDLRVTWARAVPSTFNARFSALARRYLYLFGPARALADDACWTGPELDADRMHGAAQHLLGEQDFSAVRAAACGAATPLRCVHRVAVRRCGAIVVLDIEANAFLLHMVRNIASALRQVGNGERSADGLHSLLQGRDRTRLGPTAPPQGLYLSGVRYAPGLELPGASLPPLLLTLGDVEWLC